MSPNQIITTLIAGGLLLLSFLMLSNAIKANRKASLHFGFFLFLWATYWLDEMIFAEQKHIEIFYFFILRFFQFLTPLVFYLSVQFYTKPNFRYSSRDIRHLIPPTIFAIVLLSDRHIYQTGYKLPHIVLIMGNAFLYTFLSYFQIQKHQSNIEGFSSDRESVDLHWLKYIIYSFISSAILILGYNVFFQTENLNIYINVYFLIIVYLVAFYSIRQKEIFPKGLSIAPRGRQDYFSEALEDNERLKLITDSKLPEIKDNLLNLMLESEPYLDSELNLPKLADQLHISTHQLSYVINTGFGENFFNFINKYRVEKAKKLLTDLRFNHLTIVAIGYEAGFNSKTAFNTTFKKLTTFTPSEFKKKFSDY